MRNLFLKTAAALAVAAGAASSANAFVYLKLTDVGSSVSAVCDASQLISATNCNGFIGLSATGSFIPGSIGSTFESLGAKGLTFGGMVGEFSVTTNFRTNLPGTVSSADFNESSTNVERMSGTTLTNNFTIEAIAFGYTNPFGVQKTFTGSAGFSSSDFAGDNPLVNTQQGLDVNNAGNFSGAGVESRSKLLSTTDSSAVVVGASVANNHVFPTAVVTFAGPSDPYSLASVQTYTLRVGTTINATSNMSVLPVSAPTTLALVGLAMIGLALSSRRSARG
jgi:hypothetical protein